MGPTHALSASRSVAALLSLVAAAGCRSERASCGERDHRAGLRTLAYAYVDRDERRWGHSRELVVDGDLLFLADSNGLPILRHDGGGALELLHAIEAMRTRHCSTIALHRPSRTLLCGAADSRLMTLEDVSDPERPRSRPVSDGLIPMELRSVRDIAIEGDTAWLATDVGVLRARLGANGQPGAFESTGVAIDPVQVEIVGGLLVVLDRGEGLVVLDAETLERRGSAAVAGPPLDLAVDGDRLVVSLGSEGAAVFALDAAGTPEALVTVQPRCVATAADLEGDQLAVACLSGLTLYDLSGTSPRVAGFVPSLYGMLDVAFTSFGLVAVDWYRVDVLATDPSGSAILPDVPRGTRLTPGADARVPVRNAGNEPLAIDWLLRGAEGAHGVVRSGSLMLPPAGDSVLELSREEVGAAGSRENVAEVVFSPAGDDCDGPRTRLWHRPHDDLPARGHAGVGDVFPTLSRTADSAAPPVLPLAGAETLVMFLTVDCFLQWPQLEDMAWAEDHGLARPSPTVFVLTTMDVLGFDPAPFLRHFAAERLMSVEWADYHRSLPGNEAETNPVASFERTFMTELPGADFPHDYLVDASGRVTWTSRVFRGAWPLGE